MVDEVRREIERIQGYISNGRLTQFDEANTKATAIEPVLRELGWDVVDPDEVRREHSVGNRSVDYALFCDDTLKVFIEAKNGGEPLERHQQQLLDYAFAEGVEIAVLTNGSTWWFYLPIRAVSWERRKVVTVELDQQDSTGTAQKLVDVISKEDVRSGKAIQNAERHQILETLPDVWNRLVSEPRSPLVTLLAERTHRSCVREPDRNEVEQFLSGHLEQIQITPPPNTTESVAPPEPNVVPEPMPQQDSSGRSERTTCRAFTFCGNRHEVSSGISMLVRLCELVYSVQKSRFDEVLNLRATPRSKPWFSKNSKDFRKFKPIDKTGIVVDSDKTVAEIVVIAEKLITHFGYKKGDLSIETRTL
ncbi:MAG: hypothetical protein OXT74_11085 [Candidatus Poribacteria bacterium]|nr:hypothetical protein [Candidatus Poribacteria bacterium]